MCRTAPIGPRLLALDWRGRPFLLCSAVADVTVYGGGKSRVAETGTGPPALKSSRGASDRAKPRWTTPRRPVSALERKVQKIIRSARHRRRARRLRCHDASHGARQSKCPQKLFEILSVSLSLSWFLPTAQRAPCRSSALASKSIVRAFSMTTRVKT